MPGMRRRDGWVGLLGCEPGKPGQRPVVEIHKRQSRPRNRPDRRRAARFPEAPTLVCVECAARRAG